MIEDKLRIIYLMLINGIELNDNTLMLNRISKEDVINLIKIKKLDINDNGTYRILGVNDFRHFGIELLKNSRVREAKACFEKCYELAPNDKDVCLQYMLSLIKSQKYKKVLEVYDNLESIANNDKYIKNNNLYLYLLSFIIELPKKYADKVKNMEYDDLKVPSVACNKVENIMRAAILENKFKFAYTKNNDLLIFNKDYSVRFELIKALLTQVIGCEKKKKNYLLGLAKEKKYEEISKFLNKRRELRHLGNYDAYTLVVVEAILELEKTGIIPSSTIDDTIDIYQALSGKNYQLALKINNEFMDSVNGDKSNDIVNMLLVDLNNMILDMKSYSDTSVVSEEVQSFEEDKFIKEIEEFAYCLVVDGISIDQAGIKYGLMSDWILLIKLIYARDYYIEGNYEAGDKLVYEVEISNNKTNQVLSFLNKVKLNKYNYKNMVDVNKKSLNKK